MVDTPSRARRPIAYTSLGEESVYGLNPLRRVNPLLTDLKSRPLNRNP